MKPHRKTLTLSEIPGANYELIRRIYAPKKARRALRISPLAVFLLMLLAALIVLVEFCRAMLPIFP